ncbi:MAG: DUF4143 domain-containing protein [Scrofimicrobium sp.]
MYKPRCADVQIDQDFEWAGGVLLEGPRGCGKTTTGEQHSASMVRLDETPQIAILAEEQPKTVLEGLRPRMVDEWQLAPALWNAARNLIDSSQQSAQFIFSGSAKPTSDITRHTGAGRFSRIRMRTMSLAEAGLSSGEISLRDLKLSGHQKLGSLSPLTYGELAEAAVTGGWPRLLGASTKSGVSFNREYNSMLTQVEIPESTERGADTRRLSRVLESLSRNIAGELNLVRMASEVAGDGRVVATKTLRSDLDSFAGVFAYDPVPAWSVDVRSRARLRQSEKIQLADPAMATAALGIGAERLMLQREYFGFVFESMVVRDIRAYAAIDGGQVRHYRDNVGLEIDVVIEYPDTWAAIEAKLGSTEIPKAEANLLRLANDKVDTDKVGPPSFLAIVTGTEAAYTLPSGVHVIPLATLTW